MQTAFWEKADSIQKRFCRKLMKEDLLHFVGSDCHDSRHRICRTGEAYRKVISKMGQEYADKIFIENPSGIVKMGKTGENLSNALEECQKSYYNL